MADALHTSMGLSTPGSEREKLNKLLNIFNDGKINLGERKRVKFKNVKNQDDDDENRPRMTQKVKTFYLDSFPDFTDTKVRPKSARNLLGGSPITLETAVALRQVLFGNHIHSFGPEWRKSTLNFYDISGSLAYGLQTMKCGSRAMVLGIQGYLLKHMIFDRQFISVALVRSALQPTEYERRRSLIGAICQILWQAGDRKRSCVCLQQDERSYPSDYRCRDDGITEKLMLFEFKKYQDLEMFVKRQLEQFQHISCNGVVLFLYSLILSRNVHRIYEDMQPDEGDTPKLLLDNQDCSMSLLNLLMTGKAVPYVHNGLVVYDSAGNLLPKSLRGTKDRSNIGFLFWDKRQSNDERTEVGSMLKTPKCPVWLTSINGQIGLLFSNNIDLVSDWRTENRFTVHYFTGLPHHKPCILEVETRLGRSVKGRTVLTRKQEEEKIPQLDQCIMTKWYGAAVDWGKTEIFY